MKPNILVIEDEEDIRNSIAEIFEYEGIPCIVAEEGRAGARMAREFVPDLIICDIMMPGMGGYEVLSHLRGDPLTANIPLIFLTAKADRASLRYGMELGADDYLTKPFTSDDLLAAINTRLEKKARLADEYVRQANDLRQSLVRSLPHELRTPLAGILGGAEMLLMDFATLGQEDVTSMARMILEFGKRLQRQIENYLLYAQLQIIRLDPERLTTLQQARIDFPGALIRDVATAKAAILGRSGDLVLNVTEGVVLISAENLKKIVEEIFDNAFKFSQPGSQVIVSTEIEANAYLVNVSDAGRGMSVDQVNSVGAFMQFGRKLYEQQGSGLGLAIAQQLVELHGGELWIQSEPERGTRVFMKLSTGSIDLDLPFAK